MLKYMYKIHKNALDLTTVVYYLQSTLEGTFTKVHLDGHKLVSTIIEFRRNLSQRNISFFHMRVSY